MSECVCECECVLPSLSQMCRPGVTLNYLNSIAVEMIATGLTSQQFKHTYLDTHTPTNLSLPLT